MYVHCTAQIIIIIIILVVVLLDNFTTVFTLKAGFSLKCF